MSSSDPAPLPQQQQQVASQTMVNTASAVPTAPPVVAAATANTGDDGSDHAVTAQPQQSQASIAAAPQNQSNYPASSVQQQPQNQKQPPPSTTGPTSTMSSSSGMGHYPPREQQQPQESRQGSPPTDSTTTTATSSESWNDLTHQFEASVGKPSRDALHKFFYPPSSPSSRQSRRPTSHRNSISGSSLSGGDVAALPALSSSPTTAPKDTTGRRVWMAESLDNNNNNNNNNNTEARQTRVPEPPPFTIDDDDDETDGHHPVPEQSVVPPSSSPPQHSVIHRGSPGGLDDNINPPEHIEQPIQFQRSFDVQEEQDQKYVERFWTIYDDIIILSLFTQLGVVARLAASTWFTFFDGVFQKDSPLFTNLPLNCLSCFLLGLLGSGDRLMENITTRFTPRQLQQRILTTNTTSDGVGRRDHDSNDSFSSEEEDHGEGNNRHDHGSGLRRRRRPKRAKQHTNDNKNYNNGAMNAGNSTTFHSWEPPIHWHDDLREVQLLALERRIRSSKCLILFPVMKEDADVVEHYVGEGYRGSVRQQHQQQSSQQQPRALAVETNSNGRRRGRNRRQFGKNKYNAAKLADGDADDGLFQEGTYSGDEDDFDYKDDGDNNSYNYDMEGQNNTSTREDDGRFRFDLKLTPSLEAANESTAIQESASPVAAAAATSPTFVLPSVQKLIKRAPGISTPSPSKTASFSVEAGAAASPNLAVEPQQPGLTTPEKARPNPPLYAAVSPVQQSQSEQLQPSTTPEQTTPQNVSFAAGAAAALAGAPDPDQQSLGEASGGEGEDPQIDQIIANVQANVSENINRMRRVNIADGWDVGTTPESMADDLMLGLRDGFCGALSSFSSWNSSMLHLLQEGHIGEAFVGYLLGLQLPIVAYRFGQQSAVYYFVWRCRREARREERKGGYGIRIKMDDDDDDSIDNPLDSSVADDCFEDEAKSSTSLDEVMDMEVPSVRAICTALYLLALVTQCTSLKFFSDPQDQQIALSLLFSPVGSLVRWRLSRYNNWRPGFPIGTFICNIVACALSGSLGGLLAGNPGPKERILLQSVVAGIGGTLSSLAAFIVEILAGIDPLLFRFDGVIYAICSIMWALIIGFVFSATEEWADSTA